jgi:hypothetical protein
MKVTQEDAPHKDKLLHTRLYLLRHYTEINCSRSQYSSISFSKAAPWSKYDNAVKFWVLMRFYTFSNKSQNVALFYGSEIKFLYSAPVVSLQLKLLHSVYIFLVVSLFAKYDDD